MSKNSLKQYFFIDDRNFGTKDFIPGLFVYPAFQKLCSENIKPVVSRRDCNLYSITKRLFDLDAISFESEAEFQKKVIELLNGDIFKVKSEHGYFGRADIPQFLRITN